MSRQAIRLAALATLLAIPAIPVAATASALAGIHPDLAGSPWGYVVVRKPHAATYTPAAMDRGNSAGGTNSVTWTEPGRYEVSMPGLANDTSAVAVTAMSPMARRCVVAGWFTNGSEELIDVDCFKPNGEAVDTPFILSFMVAGTQSTPPSRPGFGFGWANQPTTSDYQPTRRFNSHTGASNSVDRFGPGHYQATFNALGSTGGNVQVTAVSSSAATCQSSWAQSNLRMEAAVQCRRTGTSTIDTQFDIIVTDRLGLKGQGGTNVAYLTADRPSATSTYVASAARRYASPQITPTIKRTRIGVYIVTLKGMPLGGAALVTPLAGTATICTIGSIATASAPQRIGVRCFDRTGHPKDAKFSLSYLR
jgi:hypothetical protein